MNPRETEPEKPLPAWKSPWVIGWVALVLVVLGVNLTMVYLAIVTNPGLVAEDFYDRGQDYEQNMLSRMARHPGWQMHLDLPADIKAGESNRIRFFLTDKAGQPVTPGNVAFYAYRPSDALRDFAKPMQEEGSGRYGVDVSFPLIGVWDLLVAVGHDEDEYSVGRRIQVVQP